MVNVIKIVENLVITSKIQITNQNENKTSQDEILFNEIFNVFWQNYLVKRYQ